MTETPQIVFHQEQEPLTVSTSQMLADGIPIIAGIHGGKRARDQIPKIDHWKIKKICCIGAGYVVSTAQLTIDV